MTAQEQQMLQGLAERINGTQLPEKDPDAEQYLQMNIGIFQFDCRHGLDQKIDAFFWGKTRDGDKARPGGS